MEEGGNGDKEMEMRNIPKEKMTRLNVQMNNIKKESDESKYVKM